MAEAKRSFVETIHPSGKLTADAVAKQFATVRAAVEAHGTVSLVVDLSDFRDAQLDMLTSMDAGEVRRLTDGVSRIAVVADRQWIAGALAMAERALPGTELRLFRTGETVEARFWAGEHPEPVRDSAGRKESGRPGSRQDDDRRGDGPADGFRKLPTHRDDLLAFVIDGRLDEDAMEDVAEEISKAYKRHGKVDLMVRIDDWRGFDVRGLFDDDLWKAKAGAFRHLRRYAVVGGPPWMGTVAQFMARFMPFDIRTFDANGEAQARVWLEG